ncbi:MAG: glycoside hydrolase family 20 zincin-like fold domain-containing protein [Ferruginibacter sp.]
MNKPFKIVIVIGLYSILVGNNLFAQEGKTKYPLIPYPTNLVEGDGYFIITPATTIQLSPDQNFTNEAGLLGQLFTNSFGKPLQQNIKAGSSAIKLQYDASINAGEGYHLTITKQQVILAAKYAAGIFRGIETIRQLLPPSIEDKKGSKQKFLQLPVVAIKDEPAFAWRGMHLDVSRHFFFYYIP